jgi:hypothetical protein
MMVNVASGAGEGVEAGGEGLLWLIRVLSRLWFWLHLPTDQLGIMVVVALIMVAAIVAVKAIRSRRSTDGEL